VSLADIDADPGHVSLCPHARISVPPSPMC
jgi:hypothetical protein